MTCKQLHATARMPDTFKCKRVCRVGDGEWTATLTGKDSNGERVVVTVSNTPAVDTFEAGERYELDFFGA